MAGALSIPGMDVACSNWSAADDCSASVARTGSNVWWLAFGDQRVARLLQPAAADKKLPSEVLALARDAAEPESITQAVLAKVELDVCGAWVTVANIGEARPVLVRRAGWVELRGHPDDSATGRPLADDRIGLGPADMLLFPSAGAPGSQKQLPDELFDVALRSAGATPHDLISLLSASDPRYCAAVGVPAELGPEPLDRIAAATGLARADVRSPGYPLGDLQPDLWKTPPPPPRAARLRLTRDRASVRTVRSLLDRLLASWRLEARVDDGDLKLVATELSTNAMVHAGSPETITIRYLGDRIRVEVRDASASAPRPREAGLEAEGGRGMKLVETLSEAWGVDAAGDGKQVWCEVPVAAAS